MQIFLTLVAAAPFVLTNTYANAQSAHRIKSHANGTYFSQVKGDAVDIAKSTSGHQGWIIGTSPGPKRKAGDTQSN
jgi:hypothetical protein